MKKNSKIKINFFFKKRKSRKPKTNKQILKKYLHISGGKLKVDDMSLLGFDLFL